MSEKTLPADPGLSRKLFWGGVALAGFLFVLSFTWSLRGPLPTWGDETFTLRLAQESWAEFWEEIKLDVHPPLYFALSKLVARGAGESAGAPGEVRSLAYILFACLLWFPLNLLRRRLERANLVFLPACLFAACAHLALFGPMLRYYSLAALGVTCATLLLLPETGNRHSDERKPIFHPATWYGIAIWVAFASSYLTAVVLPAHLLFLRSRPHSEARPFWTALGVALLFSLPLLWLFAIQLAARPSAFPGLNALLTGGIARLAFIIYSFLIGEHIRPWEWWFSIPALAAFCWLMFLAWRTRATAIGALLWLTLSIGLLLGALALAWTGVGIEFSASRLMFLAPLFLILLGLAPVAPGRSPQQTHFGVLALLLLILINLISTLHFAKRTNALQSTYIIPWEEIAEDVAAEMTEDTLLLYDDDTLPYWFPPDAQIGTGINMNTYFQFHSIGAPCDFDRAILVYSPRDITAAGTLHTLINWLETEFSLVTETAYLIEDETSVRLKSILLRRPVEPVKKALRVYEVAR